MDIKVNEIDYEKTLHRDASDELLDECGLLFSQHYGTWAEPDSRAGQRITLKGASLREFLPGTNSWIATARVGGDLIGYPSL